MQPKPSDHYIMVKIAPANNPNDSGQTINLNEFDAFDEYTLAIHKTTIPV